MKTKEFSFRERAGSFRYALNGIRRFFRQEHNAWIHLVASVAVFISAWGFRVSRHEMISLVIVTGFVWSAEIFNTTIERIMDFISPEKDPRIKSIKDILDSRQMLNSLKEPKE